MLPAGRFHMNSLRLVIPLPASARFLASASSSFYACARCLNDLRTHMHVCMYARVAKMANDHPFAHNLFARTHAEHIWQAIKRKTAGAEEVSNLASMSEFAAPCTIPSEQKC